MENASVRSADTWIFLYLPKFWNLLTRTLSSSAQPHSANVGNKHIFSRKENLKTSFVRTMEVHSFFKEIAPRSLPANNHYAAAPCIFSLLITSEGLLQWEWTCSGHEEGMNAKPHRRINQGKSDCVRHGNSNLSDGCWKTERCTNTFKIPHFIIIKTCRTTWSGATEKRSNVLDQAKGIWSE